MILGFEELGLLVLCFFLVGRFWRKFDCINDIYVDRMELGEGKLVG